jgi:5-methylphenazine-1-carboxylate 1-monooxygenase
MLSFIPICQQSHRVCIKLLPSIYGIRRICQERPLNVAIVGGGIGGLSAALALHSCGIGVKVFEAAEVIKPLGVGINLQPSAVQFLQQLGLAKSLEETGVKTSTLNYYTSKGELIISDPRGKAAGYLVPQYSIHRGKLQSILLDAVRQRIGAENICTGHACTELHLSKSNTGVTIHFSNGQNFYADVAVGADGLHSIFRKQIFSDDGPPCFAKGLERDGTSSASGWRERRSRRGGLMLWRGVAKMNTQVLGGAGMFMAGTNEAKIVAYPIDEAERAKGRTLMNFIAETYLEDIEGLDWNRVGSKNDFIHLFKDWKFDWLDVPDMLSRCEEVYEFPMVDRDPLPFWSKGAVTLLGDAAHPMRPNGSNGATQAILDGRELALQLRSVMNSVGGDGRGVADALVKYEQARVGPTSAIVMENRKTGPEVVLQMAADSNMKASVKDYEGVISRYRTIAGFAVDMVNTRYHKFVETGDPLC